MWYKQRYMQEIEKIRKMIMATRVQGGWRKYWDNYLNKNGVNRFCKYSLKELKL